ncbi:MAG: IS66 family insertion sequence element accessory protein TnpA [Haliea sp.]
MSKEYTPRRTAQQWQALVEAWQQSGQSATRFCREQDIGYASFCQWRKRLLTDEVPQGSRTEEPAFIDLASLGASARGGWHIVLSLGQGVELTLRQG